MLEPRGRSFDPIQWSDGFRGMNASSHCNFSSCTCCGQAFWIEDAHRVEKVEKPAASAGRAPSPLHKFLSVVGWLREQSIANDPVNAVTEYPAGEVFHLALPSPEQIRDRLADEPSVEREAYLRRYRLHVANHPERGIDVSRVGLVSAEDKVADLEWLLAYNESRSNEDRDVVFEAELLRELGMFEASMKHMAMAVGAGSAAALAIHEQALKGCKKVCISREFEPVIY